MTTVDPTAAGRRLWQLYRPATNGRSSTNTETRAGHAFLCSGCGFGLDSSDARSRRCPGCGGRLVNVPANGHTPFRERPSGDRGYDEYRQSGPPDSVGPPGYGKTLRTPYKPAAYDAPPPAPPGAHKGYGGLPFTIGGQTINPMTSQTANDELAQPDRELRDDSCGGCGFGRGADTRPDERFTCPACGWVDDADRMTAETPPPSQSWAEGAVQPPSNVRTAPLPRVEYTTDWARSLP